MAQPPTKVEAADPARGVDLRQRGEDITREAVFDCGANLLLQGVRPSGDRIREIIGGSPHTIKPWLAEFWAWLGTLAAAALKGQTIQGVPKPLAQAVLQLWNSALASAREELKTSLTQREKALDTRGKVVEDLVRQAAAREQETVSRATGLEKALALATSQLALANQRAEGLERQLAKERSGQLTKIAGELNAVTRQLGHTAGLRDRRGSRPLAVRGKAAPTRLGKKPGRKPR
jgi:hypothetical protein